MTQYGVEFLRWLVESGISGSWNGSTAQLDDEMTQITSAQTCGGNGMRME